MDPLGYRSPWLIVTTVIGLVSVIAIASTMVLVVAIAVTTAHGLYESPRARRRRALRAEQKQRRLHRENNELRLELASAPAFEYEELADVVDRAATMSAMTTGLDTMLDRYVEVALARRQCRAALDRGEIPRLQCKLAIASGHHPREAAVLERRIAQSERVARQLNDLDDSAAELADMIRYCAEHATLPDLEPRNDVLALALDHYDACVEVDRGC